MSKLPAWCGAWSPWFAVARSVLAFSMAASLTSTPPSVLFPVFGAEGGINPCGGTAQWSLFCSLPPSESPWATVLAVMTLAWVCTGVLPAAAALPFVFVAYSVTSAGTLVDGGDQVVLVAAMLFLPYSLCDWRLSAWGPPKLPTGDLRLVIARSGILCLRLQISVVYLVASVSKLSTDAWTEGSALYYWTRIPSFGTPQWLEGIVLSATRQPMVSAALTWGTLLLEFTLAISLVLPRRFKLIVLLPAGFLLHGAILLVMGIASFSIAMFGALLILILPEDLAWRTPAGWWRTSMRTVGHVKRHIHNVVS